jgi:hypothetical protein
MAPRARKLLALATLSLACSGCAETCREVIARLGPSYQPKRAQLARIVEALPPPGSVKHIELPARLEPPIVIQESGHRINTDVLPVEKLREPDRRERGTDFWIYPNELITCVQWMGPHNPLDPGHLDQAADNMLGCEDALRQPYVFAVRTLRYDLRDAVAVEAFLVDLRSGKVVGQFPISWSLGRDAADGNEPVPKKPTYEVSSERIYSAMHCALILALRQLPGATVEVSNSCTAMPRGTRFEPLPSAPVLVADDAK